MLDYTKMAIRQTVADLKRTDYIRNVATQIIYIVYLLYNLIAGAGYLALNIVLLIISAAYFVFFLLVTSFGKSPEGKALKKRGTAVYVWCKRLIKLFTLGLTVYGICTAVGHVSALSVILAALMIVGWCLQIIFEVLIRILTNRVNFILEGLEADLDQMLKPVRSVGNFFKKMTGKEVAPPKQPTKNQLRLKEKVEAYRAELKRKKEEEKRRRETERSAEKQEAKLLKRRRKQSVKIETQLLKDAGRRAEEDRKNTSFEPANDGAKELPASQSARVPLSQRFRRWLKGEPLSPELEVPDPDLSEAPDGEIAFSEDADEPLDNKAQIFLLARDEEAEEEEEAEEADGEFLLPGEERAEEEFLREEARADAVEKGQAESAPDKLPEKKNFFRALFRKK